MLAEAGDEARLGGAARDAAAKGRLDAEQSVDDRAHGDDPDARLAVAVVLLEVFELGGAALARFGLFVLGLFEPKARSRRKPEDRDRRQGQRDDEPNRACADQVLDEAGDRVAQHAAETARQRPAAGGGQRARHGGSR